MEAGPNGPALTGDDDKVLRQALRNLWPILGETGRRQAIDAVTMTKGDSD